MTRRPAPKNFDDLTELGQDLQAPAQKLIWIVVAGTGGREEFRDVLVLPGTQARDILEKLDLNTYHYELEKPGGSVFQNNEDVYEAVTDGHVKRHLFLPPNDNYRPMNNGGEKCIIPLTRVKVAGSLDAASLA